MRSYSGGAMSLFIALFIGCFDVMKRGVCSSGEVGHSVLYCRRVNLISSSPKM